MVGWIVAVCASLVALIALFRVLTDRARRKQRGLFASWPVPMISLSELDPVFTPGPFGPTRDTEVQFIGRGPIMVPGGTSDAEAWVLAVLAKRALCAFEFGTCTGKTSYLWSRNAPAGARIVTLTLSPDQTTTYSAASGDTAQDRGFALRESAFTEFLYSGTDSAAMIDQRFGDSKQLDESPWLGWADLVFVDGSHARSYVESDSAKAMRIVKPGGLVLWHDYAGPRHAPGVFAALNALSQSLPIRHVQGTTFVAWRRPA